MGNAGTLIVGFLLVIFGAILMSGIIDFLIDMAGLIILIIGVIIVLFGLFHVFAGGNSGESGY